MNDNDINYLKNIKYQSIDLNQKFENLNDESSKFFGLGWTHNSGEMECGLKEKFQI